MLILDFTRIYENEGFDFWKETTPRSFNGTKENNVNSCKINLYDVTGTNCICDDFAIEKIKQRIRESGDSKENGVPIHFFDSGNYHYMSRIFIGELVGDDPEQTFDLVVFDHHPDMKWTSYGEILSCGSWVLNALKDIQGLENVYIIGADSKLSGEAISDHPEYENRVFFIDGIDAFRKLYLSRNGLTEETFGKSVKPVYLSVDKDVLSADEISTNWDQGEMKTEELERSLKLLRDWFGRDIIAVDVCGECAPDSPDLFSDLGIDASNRINRMIYSIFA